VVLNCAPGPGEGALNIFGAFTFGSLIKTFLPGFVLLAALALLEIDMAQLIYGESLLRRYAGGHLQEALLLAFPVAILLGLFSNIIVFMGLSDALVRAPFQRTNPGLWQLYSGLGDKLRQRCWDALDAVDGWDRAAFFRYVDPEFILLNSMGVQKLTYVREQYWYHLEFQLNLILSLSLGLIAAIVSCVINVPHLQIVWPFVSAVAIAGLLGIDGLLLAARKNYERHIAKLVSAMASVISGPTPADATA